jgi:cobalt-zinc-cadmium efflux system membrane fusion protein
MIKLKKASLWSLLFALTACGRGTPEEQPDGVRADSAMAAMPGMGGPSPSDSTATSGGASAREVTLTAAQVRLGRIRWAAVSTGGGAERAVVPGRLAPDEDRTARLGAPASGRVLTVHVQPGERVSRGRALVTIQSPEASAAQAEGAKARADVSSRRAEANYAKLARERAERLLGLKSISRQDVERAVADDAMAQASLQQAEAELRRAVTTAEQLGVGLDSSSASGQLTLRAPFDGVVLSRAAIPGAVVDAGAPLAVITDAARLWLIVDAPEALSQLFRRSRDLRFTTPAFPTDTFSARVDAVGAGLDAETRTLQIRAVVRSAAGRLRPEMLASVVVDAVTATPSIVVSEGAVQQLDGRSVVFVAKPDGAGGVRCTARDVSLGSRSGGRVVVIAGLTSGDLVITEGATAVKGQMRKGPDEMVM